MEVTVTNGNCRCEALDVTFKNISHLSNEMIRYICFYMTPGRPSRRGEEEQVKQALRNSLKSPEGTESRPLDKVTRMLRELAYIFKKDPRILKALILCFKSDDRAGLLETCRQMILVNFVIPRMSDVRIEKPRELASNYKDNWTLELHKRILTEFDLTGVEVVTPEIRQHVYDLLSLLGDAKARNTSNANGKDKEFQAKFLALLKSLGLDGVISRANESKQTWTLT